MGAGASRTNSSNELRAFFENDGEQWKDPDEKINTSLQSAMSGLLLASSDRNFVTSSKYINAVCVDSWGIINGITSQRAFCEMFYFNFHNLDPESASLHRPRTRSTSAGNTQASLLIHIIRFMLKLQDVTWKCKKHLRALGRKHVLYNIERKHVECFNEALLTTIAEIPGLVNLSEILRSWTSLLVFITEQMYLEDIKLVTRSLSAPALSVPSQDGLDMRASAKANMPHDAILSAIPEFLEEISEHHDCVLSPSKLPLQNSQTLQLCDVMSDVHSTLRTAASSEDF